MSLSRRRFLGLVARAGGGFVAAPALIGLSCKTGGGRVIAGGFVEDGSSTGHALRDGRLGAKPRRTERHAVVIVGAGVAGLCAAWELDRANVRDFVVLELASQAGGNARWGRNDVSDYPWAAHYVPVPGKQSTLVRELFRDLGVLRDDGTWDERSLCFSPQERHFRFGEWHTGLEPEYARTKGERDEWRAFDAIIAEQRASGQFTIPLETGVRRDSPLDRVSFAEWLRRFRSETLAWYADYACRDDYGALARDTSAWAGVHYFASRAHDEQGPLTWAAGNGWIVQRLLERLGPRVKTSSVVGRVERVGKRWRVLTPELIYEAEAVIFAAPRFVASYIVPDLAGRRCEFVYSPWLTANLTLERWPKNVGAPPAWDNVIYDSPSLGYVVATHQSLATHEERTVWTYYWPFAQETPANARRDLLRAEWPAWRDRILDDLERAHPDIRACVSRIDIMRYGHAMVRPTVGFLSAPERVTPPQLPGLYFAHSDTSGISIFEEAQYQGVRAARAVRRALS